MEIYLVGGAVRDQLLGYAVTERDWVVVGATPEEMLALGYRIVGADFPVFLHPQTHEEYALARTEHKIAAGYKGFSCYAAPDVTLEQDLLRRDLTINAIAQTHGGELIDPYHGQQDLAEKWLRHVSSAFAEDPLRILRVARFAARFTEFRVHPSTQVLMCDMVAAEEVSALVAERVWQEWRRALTEPQPQRFFQVLADCGALAILLPQWIKPHAGLQALQYAAKSAQPSLVRFAVTFFQLTAEQIIAIAKRYRIPQDYQALACLVSKYLTAYLQAHTATPTELLQLLEQVDALRRQERFELWLAACDVIAHVTGQASTSARLRASHAAAKAVTVTSLALGTLPGQAIRDALHQHRIAALTHLK